MFINRKLYPLIEKSIEAGKVLILYGARRTGKTVLLELLQKQRGQSARVLMLNGESRIVQDNLSTGVPEQLIRYVGDATLVIIDEAQKVPDVGQNLKLLVDSMPHVQVVASGSASFDLANKVGEPLTGRKRTAILYPVAASEIVEMQGVPTYYATLDERLIYGSYPELFTKSSDDERARYLTELSDAYLFKDILEFEQVKNARKLRDLLVLLAFQIGKEVSLTELGNSLDLHKATVARYLDLLEKAFVVHNIRGFSRNLRKEVSKTSRYYFYDNGVRNALINNFNAMHLRDDLGMLWENYVVMERLKKQSYDGMLSRNYFWRTYDQKEIDWIEERAGQLHGYEIKWNGDATAPKDWLETYSNATYEVITRDNVLDFIT